MKPKIIVAILFLTISTFLLATDVEKLVLSNNVLFKNMQSSYVNNYLLSTSYGVPAKKEKISEFKRKEIEESISKQPVKFLENKGQMVNTDGKPIPFVLFKAEASGMNVYITETGLTYVFVKMKEDEKEEQEREIKKKKETINKHEEKVSCEMAWINVSLEGASIKRENIIKEKQSTEHFNYFYGHCPEGIYDVYQYEKITIKDVYPNIDWVFYNSSKGGMKYDFIVHPNADPKQIKLIYDSEKPLSIDNNGNINIKTKLGTLSENAPYSYIHETNTEVKSSFTKKQLSKHKVEVAFSIDSLNSNTTLIIDPQLVWGTLYGGFNHEGFVTSEIDSNNNLFAAGYTYENGFPILNSGTYFQTAIIGNWNACIVKFDVLGSLLWATYYGGTGQEIINSIAIDNNNNVFAVGRVQSLDFPLQNSGTYFQPLITGAYEEAFILKFDNSGNRLWATYYGGSSLDEATSIAIDDFNNIFIVGYTYSSDFPLQNSGTFFQPINNHTMGPREDGFIIKFDNSGNRLWATYYGGIEMDKISAVAIDSNNNIYLGGQTISNDFPLQTKGGYYQSIMISIWQEAFIVEFDNLGNRIWSTYYGGSDYDIIQSVAVDDNDNVFFEGYTNSIYLPTYNNGTFYQPVNAGDDDIFILKFDKFGNCIWATYFGGSGTESLLEYDNLALDHCGNLYVGLTTTSSNMPILNNGCGLFKGIYSYNSTDRSDCFLAKFSNDGKNLWSSYIGGDHQDFRTVVTTDKNNNLFIMGEFANYTTGASLPLINSLSALGYNDNTPNGGDDCYILKLSETNVLAETQENDLSCLCNGLISVSVTCALPPYSYSWSNGVTLLNTTNTISTISSLCSGVYQVTVTSSCNQSQILSYSITSGGMPIVNISASPIIGESPLGVNFTNSSSGGTSYLWDFGNGINANTYDVSSQTYTTPGTYIVYYTTSNGNCSSTDSLIITVTDNNILIPNVFTPNGDGANDVFKISSQLIKDFNCSIYNRWGNKLFEWSDIKMGWDGKVNNKESADGTYFYIINAKKLDGKDFKKEGVITLIR